MKTTTTLPSSYSLPHYTAVLPLPFHRLQCRIRQTSSLRPAPGNSKSLQSSPRPIAKVQRMTCDSAGLGPLKVCIWPLQEHPKGSLHFKNTPRRQALQEGDAFGTARSEHKRIPIHEAKKAWRGRYAMVRPPPRPLRCIRDVEGRESLKT